MKNQIHTLIESDKSAKEIVPSLTESNITLSAGDEVIEVGGERHEVKTTYKGGYFVDTYDGSVPIDKIDQVEFGQETTPHSVRLTNGGTALELIPDNPRFK